MGFKYCTIFFKFNVKSADIQEDASGMGLTDIDGYEKGLILKRIRHRNGNAWIGSLFRTSLHKKSNTIKINTGSRNKWTSGPNSILSQDHTAR